MRDHKTKLAAHVDVALDSLVMHERQDFESLFAGASQGCRLLRTLSQALLHQEMPLFLPGIDSFCYCIMQNNVYK